MKETKKPPRRIFIGIKAPEEVAEALVRLQTRLAGLPVKLIPKEDLHLTLVPPWQETMVIRASQRLRKLLAGVPAFTLTLEKLSYGPDPWRPWLAWVACSDTEDIVAFKKTLLKAFGVRERVPFVPHITVARFPKEDETAPRRAPLDIPLHIPLRVERVQLFESPHEGGSGYLVLYDFRLSGNGMPH